MQTYLKAICPILKARTCLNQPSTMTKMVPQGQSSSYLGQRRKVVRVDSINHLFNPAVALEIQEDRKMGGSAHSRS